MSSLLRNHGEAFQRYINCIRFSPSSMTLRVGHLLTIMWNTELDLTAKLRETAHVVLDVQHTGTRLLVFQPNGEEERAFA